MLTRSTQLVLQIYSYITYPIRPSFSNLTISRLGSTMATRWDPSSTPYPQVRRDEGFLEKFKSGEKGEVQIHDPYVWLHQPPSVSEETKEFVAKQGDFARQYLDQYSDAKEFKQKLTENWDYPRFSCPALKGDNQYYFTFNSGLQAQSCIYRFPKGDTISQVHGKEPGGELFFDPNLLSHDGSVSRSSSSFSEDGQWFAYALSRSGSDWTTIYVRSTKKPHSPDQTVGKDEGRLDDDVLRFVKFSSIGWTKDSKGFFYQRFPERKEHGSEVDDVAGTEISADLNAMVYYHKVGTQQSQDILVLEDSDHPEWMFGAGGTEDGKFVVLSTSKDTGRSNLLWIAEVADSPDYAKLKWHKVINEWGDYWSEIANDGKLFYFYTNAGNSPNYKIVAYDLGNPEKGFIDIVPHKPNALLSSVHVAYNDALILLYSVDVKDELYLHELQTGKQVKRLANGLIGSIDQIAGRREDPEFWFSMTSFTSPGTVYRYDFTAHEGQEESVYRVATVKGIEPRDFTSEQVFYTSKDGTRVPMFITRHKDVAHNGTAPAILYGYGGFSHSMEPFFSPSLLTWVKHYRGVLAVANIRGGAEYGETWHLAGTKERKQNVFDDFQWAAKHLISEKFVDPRKVAISGGSNGGLLVAACVNQAPDLFGSAIADVGVLDMLRFQRFTIGRAWTSDYGSADEPDDFDYLIKYSPLHNVDPSKTYPPTMLLTADHDDRVVPLHSFKHAAELQYRLPNNPNPLLLRVDTKSGHGAGKSTEKKIEEAVDKYGFVSQSMGLTWHD